MNRQQKEALIASLNDEQKHLKWLQAIYKQAARDTAGKIAELSTKESMNPSNLQSIIYQRKYQEVIQSQIQNTLADLQKNCYTGISDFLEQCYDTGYVSAMYDIHNQGIPVMSPIDPRKVKKALEIDSKLSSGLYSRLGEDITKLKNTIKIELSRGIVEGKSWNDIANRISNGMNSPFDVAKNNAMRIARTEGHRVLLEAQNDALHEAKNKGADIVKQWDSTLDDRTRESHQNVDGEIRELDELFSNGLMFPSDPQGEAAEVINCRCALLQRAKWNLDDDELQTLKDRASFFGLDKSTNFEDFKNKYLSLPTNAGTISVNPVRVQNAISDKLDKLGVEYNQVYPHTKTMTEEEIIQVLAGGDNTKGSCASVGLAYCGQKAGLDVLDFRDGESRNFFSTTIYLKSICKLPNIKSFKYHKYSSSVANGVRLLQQCEKGKEYYFVNGRHAAIVRNTDNGLQYLELQSATRSGWQDFGSDVRSKLKWRFSETKYDDHYERTFMIDVNSLKDSDEFKDFLGYINTAADKQRKGKNGTIK